MGGGGRLGRGQGRACKGRVGCAGCRLGRERHFLERPHTDEAADHFGRDTCLGAELAAAPGEAIGGNRHHAGSGIGQPVGRVRAEAQGLARGLGFERIRGTQDEVGDLARRNHDIGGHPVDEAQEVLLQRVSVEAARDGLQAFGRQFPFRWAPHDAQRGPRAAEGHLDNVAARELHAGWHAVVERPLQRAWHDDAHRRAVHRRGIGRLSEISGHEVRSIVPHSKGQAS